MASAPEFAVVEADRSGHGAMERGARREVTGLRNKSRCGHVDEFGSLL